MTYLYQKPIEMPRGTHYGSDYWIAYSYKLKRLVYFYSMLEYANFLCLEMNYNIEYFCEQPLQIEELDEKLKKKKSIFDFWVQYTDLSTEFQEVKYTTELEGNDDSSIRSQNQIILQRNWCKNNNFNYKIVTEKDLYTGQYRIQNLDMLHSHLLRYSQISDSSLKKFINILSERNLTFEEIRSLDFLPANFELSILAYQYYLGNINFNINDRPIDNHTEVHLCVKKNIIS